MKYCVVNIYNLNTVIFTEIYLTAAITSEYYNLIRIFTCVLTKNRFLPEIANSCCTTAQYIALSDISNGPNRHGHTHINQPIFNLWPDIEQGSDFTL